MSPGRPPPPPPGSSGGSAPRGWDAPPPPPSGSVPPPPASAPRAPDDLPKAPRQYYVPADATAPPPADAPPAGAPPAGRGSSPAAPPRTRRRRRRRFSRAKVVGIVALVLLLVVLGFSLFGLWQWSRVERIPVASVLSPRTGSGTNYLIVGSDSREGFSADDPNAGAVLGDGTAGDTSQRSDTMLILRVADDGARMLSIPRDLWVTRADGSEGRINAAYQRGPAVLIQTIQRLGIPVHHYVEVDFVTFAGLVDAVGGVHIDLPYPARDDHSGLDLPEAGRVRLDGVQALAYVRSRHYAELIDGSWRTDPTGDLGRVQRQQQFLRAVMSEAGSTRNPVELMRISSALSNGLRIDDRMGVFDALSLARRLRGLDPESVALPVYGYRTSGGAAVLGLVQPDAAAVIARFR